MTETKTKQKFKCEKHGEHTETIEIKFSHDALELYFDITRHFCTYCICDFLESEIGFVEEILK